MVDNRKMLIVWIYTFILSDGRWCLKSNFNLMSSTVIVIVANAFALITM